MGWERISGNWAHWKGLVRERWGRLTDDQFAVIGGRREQLAGRIQEAYGLSKDEADRQLTQLGAQSGRRAVCGRGD